jgi:hypothetical protein
MRRCHGWFSHLLWLFCCHRCCLCRRFLYLLLQPPLDCPFRTDHLVTQMLTCLRDQAINLCHPLNTTLFRLALNSASLCSLLLLPLPLPSVPASAAAADCPFTKDHLVTQLHTCLRDHANNVNALFNALLFRLVF